MYLTDKDFSITQGKKGYLLATKISGVSLVLFYSTRCKHCPSVISIFQYLQNRIRDCRFALVNVGTYHRVVEMSKKTLTNIDHVPFLVMYLNGVPFYKYKGNKDASSIENFVLDVLSRTQNHPSFINKKTESLEENYGIGIPFNVVCDRDECCYITARDIYRK